MLIMALALAQTAAAAPALAPEAESLGVRLARSGAIAAQIKKDLSELAKENATLSVDEKKRLMALGRKQGEAGMERLMTVLGREYARRLSVDDLRVLVAQHESPAAARWKAAQPASLIAAMQVMGALDLKKETATAFCRETGKLCSRD